MAAIAAAMPGHEFATTRWSLVRQAAAAGTADGRAALAGLCERYWPPLYACARRLGYAASDAEDLTQGFFTHLLDSDFLSRADVGRGRFRSYLLSSFQNFVANVWRRDRAAKRGGGRLVSLDYEGEERRVGELTDRLTPEVVFERRWAMTLLERALATVGDEWVSSGRGELFVRLKPLLIGEAGDDYRDLTAELGMTEGALRTAVHRLRRQFAGALREQILETVSSVEEVDDEIRYLLNILSQAPLVT
ncbi:MAG: RNA polymerase sigma factor [Vicinamibacterales bacterium]